MSKEKRALVAIAKEPEIQASVTKVFDLMGGVTNMIEKGSTVVLKPNAGHPLHLVLFHTWLLRLSVHPGHQDSSSYWVMV